MSESCCVSTLENSVFLEPSTITGSFESAFLIWLKALSHSFVQTNLAFLTVNALNDAVIVGMKCQLKFVIPRNCNRAGVVGRDTVLGYVLSLYFRIR